MIRWFVVIVVALIVISGLSHWLQKIGFGRLPGDFRFRLFGKEWFIPITSTVVMSVVVGVIARLI
jgi:hypothetical protein